jgi:glycosyltransferase involved in cell wall biosynthesis
MASSLVSVILNVKNGSKHVKSLLNSLERQTHRAIELVIIDGGSSDDTLAICDEWKTGTLIDTIIIDNRDELNIVESYRLAANVAKGRYLITIGHDDAFYDSDWLEIATNYLDFTPDCSMVWGCSLIMNSISGEVIDTNPAASELIFTDDPLMALTQFGIWGRLPVDVNAVVLKDTWLNCFPKEMDPSDFIYIPHAHFFANFYFQGNRSKFFRKNATSSTSEMIESRRQVKFAVRERNSFNKLKSQIRSILKANFFHNTIFHLKSDNYNELINVRINEYGRINLVIVVFRLMCNNYFLRLSYKLRQLININ